MVNTNKEIIAIIGAYPPPYGGVSVHIKRLHEKLDKFGIENNVYDLNLGKNVKNVKKENVFSICHPVLWFIKFIFTSKERIVHIHFSDWRLRFLISIMNFFGKSIIITIHGESLDKAYSTRNFLRKILIKKTLFWSSHIITMNEKIRKLCLSLGVESEKVTMIPSFLSIEKKEESNVELTKELEVFIKSHSPIILANAYKLRFFNNQDLYGLDLCIDACSILRNDFPKVGFIFCLPQIGDYSYFEKMNNRIKEKNLKNNFMIYTKIGEMIPILKMSDIFIRPTNTDGDAISIREALSFTIPVIASDIVQRPKSVVLFKNRNLDDFVEKIKNIINDYENYKKLTISNENENNFTNILDIYQKILNGG